MSNPSRPPAAKSPLVVGSSGLIGHAVLSNLSARDDWSVRGICGTGIPAGNENQCDLTNAEAAQCALSDTSDVTFPFAA
jgi:nucleoside-diphosphate-sugar epimerase